MRYIYQVQLHEGSLAWPYVGYKSKDFFKSVRSAKKSDTMKNYLGIVGKSEEIDPAVLTDAEWLEPFLKDAVVTRAWRSYKGTYCCILITRIKVH